MDLLTPPKTQTETGSRPLTVREPPRLLVDSRQVRLQLVEDANTPGKVIVRGEFAKCGIATENKRVYPSKLWEREIKRLGKAMESRHLMGELDHPGNARTELSRVSHIITKLEVKDGVVIGEAEILDTAKGRDLKAILQATGSVGVSSRGYGSVATNENGEQVVQDDYRLVTYDFVADPADQDAFPDVFYEHKEAEMSEAEMAQKFAEAVAKAKEEGRESAEAALRDEFAKEVVTKIAEVRQQMAEEIRGELLADPTIGYAKAALDKVKEALRPFVLPEDAQIVAAQKNDEIAELKKTIAEQSLRIKDLEDDTAKLESIAKEAGFKFFVERQIAGDPDSDLIRRLIGDVTVYKSSDELKDKILAVREDLENKRAEAAKLSEQIEAEKRAEAERKEKERERAVQHEAALSEEVSQLRDALKKSMQANKQLSLVHYAEQRLRFHPKATQIRPLIESTLLESESQVDSILSKFREKAEDADSLETVRARVRQHTQGGHGPTAIEEETPARPRSENDVYAFLGTNLAELRNLAGMEDSPLSLTKKAHR